uniref:Ribonuclease H-like domain-containing protein n=1 Tax=Tanacetum cinerariifolium TaxID=118510 RepID=A0A6L2NZH1_TANCI|nr:ribonuclease H-like domain-containing protein [Tanacetum cinerariifolium]
MSYLSDFEELNGGYVAFGGNPKGGKISGKGKIRTGKLDFDDVYFVKELQFNLFSVSHMCDKKNSVLFTDTECLVLSLAFKLPDENQVLLRVPRENNMYNTTIPKPKSNGNSRNRKACFVCKSLDHLIKDLLTKSKHVPINAARPVTAAVPKPHVTRPRQAKTVVTKPHSLPKKNINHSPSPKASTFPPKVTTTNAPMVNAVKENWVWKPKCLILDHVSRNTSASMTLKRPSAPLIEDWVSNSEDDSEAEIP